MNETRAKDTAALGGPTASALPAERSLGKNAPARLKEADQVIGNLLGWLGQCTAQEFVDWRISCKTPGFEQYERDHLVACVVRAMDAGWQWAGEHARAGAAAPDHLLVAAQASLAAWEKLTAQFSKHKPRGWVEQDHITALRAAIAKATMDGCQSGAASPAIGSVPNTAAETDGTNTGGKTNPTGA
jgi:hypothetical protein